MLLQNVGQTGLRLNRRGKRRSVAPRPRLSVTADGDVDDPRIKLANLLVPKTEAIERARAEILNDDVRVAAHVDHDFACFRPVEVDAEVALTGILLRIVDRHAVDVRHASATRVAAGRFDLCDVGAEIAQCFGAQRAREHACEVDDSQPVEWCVHDQFPSNTAEPGPVFAKACRPRLWSALVHITLFTSVCCASAPSMPRRAERFASFLMPPRATVGPAAS